MVIVMMPFRAVVRTKRVSYGIIGRWNIVNYAFLKKYLQGAVDRYPVEFFSGLFFNIAMRQCPPAV